MNGEGFTKNSFNSPNKGGLMSLEQAKAFIERMKTDDAFREKVLAIEAVTGRLACIQAEGFDCTPEEINEAGWAEVEGVLGRGLWGWRGSC